MSALYQVSPDVFALKLSGPLTTSQSQDVVQLFQYLSEQDVECVVVDLEDVPLIDSRGLVTLVAGYKIFGGDPRKFRLAAIQNQPKLVLELTGFDQIFFIADSVDEAMPIRVCTPIPLGWQSLTFSRPAMMDVAA